MPGLCLEIFAFLDLRAVLGLGIVGGRAVLSEAMESGCTGSRKSSLVFTLHPAIQLHSSVEVGSQRPSCEEALCFCESCPSPPTMQMNVYQAFIMATRSLATCTQSPPFLTAALGGGSYE